MPSDGVLIQLTEYSRSTLQGRFDRLLSGTPQRPGQFTFDDGTYASYECSGPSYQFNFRDRGRVLAAQIWINRRRVDQRSRSEALKVLDGMRFEPGEVTVARRVRASSVKLPGRAIDAAIGGGSLWAISGSGGGPTGWLVRMDSRSGRELSIRRIREPHAVAFGQGGVWVIESRRGRVLRFDPHSGQRLASIPLSLDRAVTNRSGGKDFLPFDVAVGEGATWVSTARGAVAKIDPGCNCVVRQIPIPFQSSANLAVAEGGIWIGGDLDGVIRIDVETGEQTAIPIEGPGGRRLQPGEFGTTTGRIWVGGDWAAPVRRTPGSFVSTDESAIVELAPDGRVLGVTPVASGRRITPTPVAASWFRDGPLGRSSH